MQISLQPLQTPPHIRKRPPFAKQRKLALQRMTSLAYAWWHLQWLGLCLHFQLSGSCSSHWNQMLSRITNDVFLCWQGVLRVSGTSDPMQLTFTSQLRCNAVLRRVTITKWCVDRTCYMCQLAVTCCNIHTTVTLQCMLIRVTITRWCVLVLTESVTCVKYQWPSGGHANHLLWGWCKAHCVACDLLWLCVFGRGGGRLCKSSSLGLM